MKHQSSQQLVRGGEAHSKPSPTTQPPTHHVSRETIAITKSRRESWKSPFGKHNSPFPTIPTISVSLETSIDLSSCHTHRSLKIPQTHPNKLPQFQHPPRFTWNTKPQQPIGERQRTLNAISCNSTIRSCFTWNHSSIFRTQQTYVSRETSGSYQTLGKHNTK